MPAQRLFLLLLLSASSRAIKSARSVFSRMFFAILSDFFERFALTPASTLIVAPLKKLKILESPFFSVPILASALAFPSMPELTSVINSVVFFNSPPAIICIKSATNASSKYITFKKLLLSIFSDLLSFKICLLMND